MWTMTNTEGFTQEQLDTINEARTAILKESCADADHVDDALCNEWAEHISAGDLRDAVLARFGLKGVLDPVRQDLIDELYVF